MRALTLPLLAIAALLASCEDAPSTTTIPREQFIDTWIELRREALNARSGAVDEAARAAVLSRMQVTEDDLLAFAEVHGRDPEYMRAVWNEVGDRLEEISFEPTTPPDSVR